MDSMFIEEIDVEKEDDEDEVFIPYDITSYPSDYTLQVLFDMWKAGDIIVPDFQRNYVWDIRQASLLIDSFLMGLPIPQLFFYVEEKDNKYIVIDGLQRILSVVFFMEGYFGFEHHGKRQIFKLNGLDARSPYHNKTFEELNENFQRKVKGSVLRVINIRQIKPTNEQTSKYHIFERLNTGGTPLKPQEIRNCVFHGKFSQILKDLNMDSNWRKILGKKFDKHQKDVELILRLFALQGQWMSYEKPMKEFLNIAMSKNVSGETVKVEDFSDKFSDVCKLIVDDLGEKPFHLRGPLNTSVMDAVFCTIFDNFDNLVPDLKQQYRNLCADDAFRMGTYYGTSDRIAVQARFSKAKKFLAKQ